MCPRSKDIYEDLILISRIFTFVCNYVQILEIVQVVFAALLPLVCSFLGSDAPKQSCCCSNLVVSPNQQLPSCVFAACRVSGLHPAAPTSSTTSSSSPPPPPAIGPFCTCSLAVVAQGPSLYLGATGPGEARALCLAAGWHIVLIRCQAAFYLVCFTPSSQPVCRRRRLFARRRIELLVKRRLLSELLRFVEEESGAGKARTDQRLGPGDTEQREAEPGLCCGESRREARRRRRAEA